MPIIIIGIAIIFIYFFSSLIINNVFDTFRSFLEIFHFKKESKSIERKNNNSSAIKDVVSAFYNFKDVHNNNK
jgi:hypothetical protein